MMTKSEVCLFALASLTLIAAEKVTISPEGVQILENTNSHGDTGWVGVPKSHALFSLNYATLYDDGQFNLWDHDVLEHWDREIGNKYPRGISYRPPDDLPSRWYPMHGVYSSSSTSVLQAQLNEAKAANIELLVIPFTISQKEAQSLSPYVMTEFHSRKFTDLNLPKLLKYAEKEGMKVGFLIEEFRGRNCDKIFKQMKYLIETYYTYESFFPIFYIYDAHHVDMTLVLSHTESLDSIRKWYQKFIAEQANDRRMHEKLYVISSWVDIDSGHKALVEGYMVYLRTLRLMLIHMDPMHRTGKV